ncbi:putative metallo-hydrolase [Ditylenchus destructor]|uniref:Metallo-hydrolase n=1 Tax=Ditylenchus destructor TaxID=166010 RepID=A0AAD4QSQ2_9BILA|nr:putative metallo-hydrolase [Ditylenchus destructor]
MPTISPARRYQVAHRRMGRYRRAYPRCAEDLPPGVQLRGSADRRLGLRPAVRGWRPVHARDPARRGDSRPAIPPADVAYRIGDAVFVGDTLFMPDYGTARTDFPGGDARTLYRSIRRLLTLPDDTRLFLCHGL